MNNRQWRKLDVLYTLEGKSLHEKLMSHAANPLPIHIEGDVYRIYYSGRDLQNRSSVGAVDIDIVSRKIIKEHKEPFFIHGPKGSFYESGVSVGCCYSVKGQPYILFMGWQTPEVGHWYGEIGRLKLNSDLSLTLDTSTPFLALNNDESISLSYPSVIQDEQGYYMWYGSTLSWESVNGEMVHVIYYATSKDGHTWERHGLAVPYGLGKAQAFSRPTVVKNPNGEYEMWFSYRSGTGEKYRIGYAYSKDGRNWELLLEKTGIDVSNEGWDSEMIEYPFVFDHKGERYMLYSGNAYGKTGFGLAILEK